MIKINHLTKRYRSGKGIFDITFEVNKGEVFGFLGPNGAGKTTTIRQLLGLTNANEGTCTIGGLDTRLDAAKIHETLGVILSEIMFPGDLDVGRFFLLNLHAYALYTVIGGIGFIASTIADDKNVSLSAGIGFPVFFLVMQMLGNADPQLENFKYLSLFTLFDPQLVSTDPTAVWGYIGVLVGLSTLLYSAAHLIFTKKNLYV